MDNQRQLNEPQLNKSHTGALPITIHQSNQAKSVSSQDVSNENDLKIHLENLGYEAGTSGKDFGVAWNELSRREKFNEQQIPTLKRCFSDGLKHGLQDRLARSEKFGLAQIQYSPQHHADIRQLTAQVQNFEKAQLQAKIQEQQQQIKELCSQTPKFDLVSFLTGLAKVVVPVATIYGIYRSYNPPPQQKNYVRHSRRRKK